MEEAERVIGARMSWSTVASCPVQRTELDFPAIAACGCPDVVETRPFTTQRGARVTTPDLPVRALIVSGSNEVRIITMRLSVKLSKGFEYGKQSTSHELPLLDLEVCPVCHHTKLAGQPCKSAFCQGKLADGTDTGHRRSSLLARWLRLAS